jgi:hypothetical protein
MAAREFSLSFETTPPTAARPGLPFTVPVIIAVNPIGTPAQNLQHLVVSASLRNEASTGAAAGLTGNLTASVCSRTDNAMSGYAKFSSLTISQPGKFRLRIMLSAASYGGVVTKEYVDSAVIHVHAGATAQRPSGSSPLLNPDSYYCDFIWPSFRILPTSSFGSFSLAPLPPRWFSLGPGFSASLLFRFRSLADT